MSVADGHRAEFYIVELSFLSQTGADHCSSVIPLKTVERYVMLTGELFFYTHIQSFRCKLKWRRAYELCTS